MRKVSYTQMRAELSDILDAIRNGETVVVTQRGRPDTVLNGSLSVDHELPAADYSHFIIHKEPECKTRKATSVYRIGSKGELIEMKPLNELKISFREALNKTQKKHAKIIKALEDK
ncbi:type II toxin-antitoxin system Phd/YefM family antitoxin [Enterobacter bugandensis]|uniref:type II toxin-antitoxin system Phd/YefM family antitoxin n=1 Tax=Enterobacter bugandensis TaxID=881260 RepID=UPI00168105E5|nr:type II toxin-antitoxin system prevent-host-death family antitoxin [Enterobacter bugandensis]